MAHPYQAWTAMPDDELVALYDSHAPNVAIGLSYIMEELTRRQEAKQMARMESLSQLSAGQISKWRS